MTRKAEIKEIQNWLLKSYSGYIKLRPMIVTLFDSGSFGMHILIFAFGKKLKIDFIHIWKLAIKIFHSRLYLLFSDKYFNKFFYKLLKIMREKKPIHDGYTGVLSEDGKLTTSSSNEKY